MRMDAIISGVGFLSVIKKKISDDFLTLKNGIFVLLVALNYKTTLNSYILFIFLAFIV